MAQDWDIKPRGHGCARCEATFADRQAYWSLLTQGDEGYIRGDYCESCWPEMRGQKPVSSWRGVFRMPPPKEEPPLRKETAETLLRRLMEVDDSSRQNVIFILAVMLERNKLFIERDIQKRDDGIWIRVYEHRKTGETFLVPDPRLRLDELENVQEEVVVLLGGQPRKGKLPADTGSSPDLNPFAAELDAADVEDSCVDRKTEHNASDEDDADESDDDEAFDDDDEDDDDEDEEEDDDEDDDDADDRG